MTRFLLKWSGVHVWWVSIMKGQEAGYRQYMWMLFKCASQDPSLGYAAKGHSGQWGPI